MPVPLVVGLFIFATCTSSLASPSAFGQPLKEDQSFTAPPEVSPGPSSSVESPAASEPAQVPEILPQRSYDPVTELYELRDAVRTSPENGADRLALAETLYRIGDLDAALDECRSALRLLPGDARAQLQLGVILMAKQSWKAAATALAGAIQLDPAMTHAHYSLGSVQYSLGNLKAAIQSYRRALELHPQFPDARYRLALVLKLTNQNQEAVGFMEEAAVGGIPEARYFMGNAYRNGQGVEKNLARAIGWWSTAVEIGYQRAAEPLSKLRRQALSSDASDRRRKEAIEGFQQYRDSLWSGYPDLTKRIDPNESLGVVLLRDNQATNSLTILCAEVLALSEPALDELAQLYSNGLENRLAPFEKRLLSCLETTAADGFLPAKKALARIYGKGLGVPADLTKAKTLLKGLPKQEIKAVLDEIATP